MGVVRGGKEHEAAIQAILQASKKAGKKTAIFCELSIFCPLVGVTAGICTIEDDTLTESVLGTSGDQALARSKEGFDMVSIITDLGALEEGISSALWAANGGETNGKPRDQY